MVGDLDTLLHVIERKGELRTVGLDQGPLRQILGFGIEDQRDLHRAGHGVIDYGDREIAIGIGDVDDIGVEQVDLVAQELAQRDRILGIGVIGLFTAVDDIKAPADRDDLLA